MATAVNAISAALAKVIELKDAVDLEAVTPAEAGV